MLAPTRLFWQNYDDADIELPRCGWSNEQWEKMFIETWVPETQALWRWCKNEQNVQTPAHFDNVKDKIFRFACMSQTYCVQLRAYYISKGNNIQLTSHEIWESLTISRKATTECRYWKSGSKTKVMRRICFVGSKWNRVSNNQHVNNFINRYLAKYKSYDETSYFRRTDHVLPQNKYIFEYDTQNFVGQKG